MPFFITDISVEKAGSGRFTEKEEQEEQIK